ncbi:xanthine dehydrogenase family protein molybdopterin-binding subunit [Aestuariispira insulae]|uniref:Isoquinoline 1-oxidoreductase beta subunit n=1 Tax=Aestuariispira insulae TaxID=1461337 RepID=A0A3D9HY94_9PROT|nr:xanthine dehydrogenase family protein molybdopterin-binding subunit [Aestuariispira insulae]RED54390.1 isoquinoline 1-oxidoreductase beta subunit [Aestuariispira insulae]
MNQIKTIETSRRGFLKGAGTAATGLVVGFQLTGRGAKAAHHEKAFEANAFVRIAKDNSVTVIAKHIEFGQGSHSGLATILADELDADWAQVRVEAAPADATKYNNLFWGPSQGTGGSTAIANSWMQLREAGAKARAMLVQAAAAEWNVAASQIQVSKGMVSHGGKSLSFGELAEKAAMQPVPETVTLKTADQFTLIGGTGKRKDIPGKTDGTAIFTMDVKRPGMLYAVLKRSPKFGGVAKSFDDAATKEIKGVVGVVATPRGVAVLAKNTWAAIQGADALAVEWDNSQAEQRSSAEIMAHYHELADQPGATAVKNGDADGAIAGAVKTLEASFDFPYLAHAPMEPLDAVIEVTDQGAEIWTGSQIQTGDQAWAAGILGLKPEQVKVNTLLAGGSFGRRATPDSDMVSEAAMIAKAIEGRAPVKLIWTREDDVRGGRYRPAYHHRLKAALDEQGNLIGWQHKIVGQSIAKGTAFEPFLVKDGVDATSVEGAHNLPYAIPNMDVSLVTSDIGVPVLWWRSVGSTHTAYSTETFLDELAEAAGRDPVEWRLELMKDHPRHLAALKLVAEKAEWGKEPAPGRYRGVAVHESFNSVVAQVAEVSLRADATIKVEKIWCAVDCGTVINPDVVAAQMEGGIGYGLGAILRNQITLDGGVVDQSNFHDYEPLRLTDMPDVEVFIVPSDAAPTGVGEPGVPPVGPAVANAVYQATGKRIRKLPFTEGLPNSV